MILRVERRRHPLAVLARGTTWVVFVAGVCVGILGALGIVQVWQFRAMQQERIAATVLQVDQVLAKVDERLGRVDARLVTGNLAEDTVIGQTIVSLSTTLVSVNGTLTTIDRLPFIEVKAVDTGQLSTIAERFTALSGALSSGAVSDATRPELAIVRGQIADTRQQLSLFESRSRQWLDRAAVLFTLLFTWLSLSQISVCGHAWAYARRD